MIAEHSHTHTRAMHHPLANGTANGISQLKWSIPSNAFHSPRKMKIVNNTDLVACSISEAIQVIKLHFYRVARNSAILIVWPISLTYAWRLRSL